MNRSELQALAKIRRREAAELLKAKRYEGAYYLAGYSIECALKACIARQTQKHDFPDKDLASKGYVHNLEQLLRVAGLEPDLEHDMKTSKALGDNWLVVKDWKESSRYLAAIPATRARNLYSACTSKNSGILRWIQTRW
jgi:HEPN domain-containing protein